jgi:hypothetical protein
VRQHVIAQSTLEVIEPQASRLKTSSTAFSGSVKRAPV